MKTNVLILFCLLLLLANCTPLDSEAIQPAWVYTDLRLLDPADSPDPTLDLIALYTRTLEQQEQIRLDLLEHAYIPNYDLYLFFDTKPGGTTQMPFSGPTEIRWERLFIIPSYGRIQILDHQFQKVGKAALNILRDPIQDSIVISFARESLYPEGFPPGKTLGYSLEVYLTPSASHSVVDQLAPTRSDCLSPPPASVLFTFWNSFPAYTPATALRRWSGAHTGPLGGRHGLSYLLSRAQAARIPIVLLDLNTPAFLSALDQIGKIGMVQELAKNGEIILPEALPQIAHSPRSDQDAYLDVLEKNNFDIYNDFGIAPSLFAYSEAGTIPNTGSSKVVFTKDDDPSLTLTAVTPIRWQDKLIIPVSYLHNQADSGQATTEGLSLQVKLALLESALSASDKTRNASPILLLGGELGDSTWGVPNLARISFHYLNNHPWIQPLGANDLTALSGQPFETNEELVDIPNYDSNTAKSDQDLEKALSEAPDNVIRQAAWQAYTALTAPVSPSNPELPRLRATYVPGVWSLIEASKWGGDPYELSTCDLDPDRDGQPECIIASQNYFILFEIESGALSFAFFRFADNAGEYHLHQVIAPSSQFISGLSDPLFWRLDESALSDPNVIPGAFADASMSYQATLISKNQLLFRDPQSKVEKSFEINAHQINVIYQRVHPDKIHLTQIPLALDPWMRFTPQWAHAYQEFSIKDAWGWKLDASISVQVTASNEISAIHFNQSRSDLVRGENPNKDYPAGHFLPYPLALLEIPVSDGLKVCIEISRNAIMK